MNDTEKKFTLLSQLDIIMDNNYNNNQYYQYCFHDIRLIAINRVYYYIKSIEYLSVQLHSHFMECNIICDGKTRHAFDVNYCDIDEVIIQIR